MSAESLQAQRRGVPAGGLGMAARQAGVVAASELSKRCKHKWQPTDTAALLCSGSETSSLA